MNILNKFRRKKETRHHKGLIIFAGVLLFLVVLRILAPTIIKTAANIYLKDFSPTLTGHIDNVDLAILRMRYGVSGIKGSIKGHKHPFVEIKGMEADLPWRELLKGKPLANILIRDVDFIYTNQLMPAVKKHLSTLKEDGNVPKDKSTTLRIGRVDVKNSSVRTNLFPSQTREEGIIISKLNIRATNVTPDKNTPITPFSLNALLLGSGEIKTEGEARLGEGKPEWTADAEILNFNLTALNRFLKKNVPLTFTRGKLDLYAEAASRGPVINGYAKPFIKGVDVIKTNENFKGAKHWLIEVLTAIANMTLKEDETMATRIPFSYGKTLLINKNEAIAKTIGNGFRQKLDRGVENSIGLEKRTRQVQEER